MSGCGSATTLNPPGDAINLTLNRDLAGLSDYEDLLARTESSGRQPVKVHPGERGAVEFIRTVPAHLVRPGLLFTRDQGLYSLSEDVEDLKSS